MSAAHHGMRRAVWRAAMVCLIGLTTGRVWADGPALAGLAVGNNADGRLEVFHVRQNGELRHRWQRAFTHDWSSWSTLGSGFGRYISVTSEEGRLAVFGVRETTRTVDYSFQKEPNSPEWSKWASMPFVERPASVAVAKNARGSFTLFVVGADSHAVWTAGELSRNGEWTSPAEWSKWTSLGGKVDGWISAVKMQDGLFRLIGLDAQDGTVVTCRETNAESWSGWTGLGEQLQAGFAVAQNVDGRVEIFGLRRQDGNPVRIYQLQPAPDSGWSNWIPFGPKLKPGFAQALNVDGRIEVFAVDRADGMIFHSFQARGGSTNWRGWTDMSLAGSSFAARHERGGNPQLDAGALTSSYPVVGTNEDGKLQLFSFGPGSEKILYGRAQLTGSLLWADWSSTERSGSQYRSRIWRIDDGLPDNRVQAITETPDGYMWIGTRRGLARFDGVTFTAVPTNSMHLSSVSITCLAVDPAGALWVGSDGGGASRLAQEGLAHYGEGQGLAGDAITALAPAQDGSIWIGTRTGLSCYTNGSFINYRTVDGLDSDWIRGILKDSTGTLWVSTSRGLNELQGGKFKPVTEGSGLRIHSGAGLFQDVPGRFWMGSDRGLLFSRGAGFFAYDEAFGLSDRHVNVVQSDSQGDIWLGTDSGLSRFQEGRFWDELDSEGHPFGRVNCLCKDEEGNLWVGSDNGLSRLAPKNLLTYTRQQGLAHDNITAAVEDESGRFWLGNNSGLDQLNGDNVTTYSRSNGFPMDAVNCLCAGRNSELWAGGNEDGGVVEIKDGDVTHLTRANGLTAGDSSVIYEDSAGTVWIGTTAGLSCFEHEKMVTNPPVVRLAGRAIRDICENTSGTLWIATANKLYSWGNGQLTDAALPPCVINCVYCDRDNSLWIGTEASGIIRWRNGATTRYTTLRGLYSDEIFNIVEDDAQWLWMSCSRGIFRVRKADFEEIDARRLRAITSFAYGHKDGMASVLCSNGKPGAWKSRDGRLWFVTSAGIVAINPNTIHVNRALPSVYVEQVLCDGVPLLKGNPLPRFSNGESLEIPPSHKSLEIHYTGLKLASPEQIRFRYELEGVDQDWTEAGTRRVAYYNNLAPGAYVFHISACNNDGWWTPVATVLRLTIAPMFWQTWWFQLACAMIIAAAIGGAARFITRRKMLRRLARMQQRHAIELERTRIARDMHDELGAKLTRMSFQGAMARRQLDASSEAAAHVEKMAQTARELVFSLDEIVWAVDPKHDTLDEVANYICRYATKFFEDSSIRCKFDIPTSLPDCHLSTDVRHNVYLAMKEALNNVLKHSQASRVEISLKAERNGFEIGIADDGRGMDLTGNGHSQAHRAGNGLTNLRERLSAVHGHCEIRSAPSQGTVVRLIVPDIVIRSSD